MKRIASLILLVLTLAFPLAVSATSAELPKPVGDIYVQDHANILSPEEKRELVALGRFLEDKTKAQIAVLAVDSLGGVTIEEYANKSYNTYGIGDKELNNGVLLILALGEREIRIEVGYGLEGILPDGKTGRILDEFAIPYLQNNLPNKAIVETYKTLFNEVAIEYNLDPAELTSPRPYDSNAEFQLSPVALVFIVIIVAILVILDFRFFGGLFTHLIINILSIFFNSSGNGRSGGGGSSGGGGASRRW